MIRKYSEIFCWKNVSSFCTAKATHIFSAKNFRILYIEFAKTVNEMTLNELVKLTRFEQLGPDIYISPWNHIYMVSHENSFDGNSWSTTTRYFSIKAYIRVFLFSQQFIYFSPWTYLWTWTCLNMCSQWRLQSDSHCEVCLKKPWMLGYLDGPQQTNATAICKHFNT